MINGYQKDDVFPRMFEEECKIIVKREQRLYLMFICWLPYGVFVIFPLMALFSYLFNAEVGEYSAFVFAVPYMLYMAVLGTHTSFVNCPRCGDALYMKNLFWGNRWRNSCIHCDLKFRTTSFLSLKGFSYLIIFILILIALVGSTMTLVNHFFYDGKRGGCVQEKIVADC